MKTVAEPPAGLRLDAKRLLAIVAVAVALYAVLPQFGGLHSSYPLLRKADWHMVGLAIAVYAVTYFAAAATYWFLALRRLAYGRTLLVQIAGNCVNRLLPSGVGALGVSYLFLRRSKHDRYQAVAVVAVNNMLGFIGNLLLIVIAVSLDGGVSPVVSHGRSVRVSLWIAIGGVCLLLGIVVGWRFRTTISHKFKLLYGHLLSYRWHPQRLALALFTSMVLTAANAACLMACAGALHTSLSAAAALLVLTVGVSAATAVPTPGGIGGLEAGVWAGLVSTGLAPSQALATVLLYRLITYWLAIVVGSLALVVCIRRKLIALQ